MLEAAECGPHELRLKLMEEQVQVLGAQEAAQTAHHEAERAFLDDISRLSLDFEERRVLRGTAALRDLHKQPADKAPYRTQPSPSVDRSADRPFLKAARQKELQRLSLERQWCKEDAEHLQQQRSWTRQLQAIDMRLNSTSTGPEDLKLLQQRASIQKAEAEATAAAADAKACRNQPLEALQLNPEERRVWRGVMALRASFLLDGSASQFPVGAAARPTSTTKDCPNVHLVKANAHDPCHRPNALSTGSLPKKCTTTAQGCKTPSPCAATQVRMTPSPRSTHQASKPSSLRVKPQHSPQPQEFKGTGKAPEGANGGKCATMVPEQAPVSRPTSSGPHNAQQQHPSRDKGWMRCTFSHPAQGQPSLATRPAPKAPPRPPDPHSRRPARRVKSTKIKDPVPASLRCYQAAGGLLPRQYRGYTRTKSPHQRPPQPQWVATPDGHPCTRGYVPSGLLTPDCQDGHVQPHSHHPDQPGSSPLARNEGSLRGGDALHGFQTPYHARQKFQDQLWHWNHRLASIDQALGACHSPSKHAVLMQEKLQMSREKWAAQTAHNALGSQLQSDGHQGIWVQST
uniref:Uncharacterized protein n=1 Tax=Eutreptiella gymnastica TaxID=73025 RepID=A0A7S1IX77_9EUGL|mmetsp:Transcript_50379/g.90044  ORF Transcript_50379/g.90044 Transcript_50379/m.90044 type:complete len:571 (+) Transcript_50379:352-2064(+)